MKLEKVLFTVLLAGICLALLTPFIIAPVTYSYIFGKAVFFQIIIELLLPAWIILVLLNPKYRPCFNFLTISILIFFGALLLAALFGTDFGKSFWGYDSRMNGIFTLLHFLGFYFILSTLFKKEIYKKIILFFTIGASFVISATAILEHFYLSFRNFIGGEERVIASLGNPIFLATYLLFHFFIALFLFTKVSNLKYKILIGAVGVVNLVALSLTETRGAFIALIVSIFFIFIYYVFLSKKRILKILLVLLILASVVGSVFIWFNRNSIWVSRAPVIKNLVQIAEDVSKGGGTAKTRFLIWGSAFEAWKEKPILGWGPENFDIAYDKYYNPESLNYSYYETWGDKAHNLPLEILATSGIVGLVSYLLIFCAVLWTILKTKDKHKIILVGLFIAYFIQNLFIFDSPSSLLIFFMMMAYVSERENKKDIDLQLKSRQYNILTVSLILLIVSVLSSIFLNTRPVIASNYAIKSIDALFLDPKIGEDYFKKSVDIWSPYHDAARIKFSNAVYLLVNNDILNKAEKKQLVLYAINEVKKSELNHPNDFSYPLTLGNLYSSIEEYPLAYEEYERALTLSPKRQVVYFQFASAKFLAGEENEARDILRRAVELNKNVKESHWRLGLGLIGDDNQVAIEEAKKAIMLGYYPPKMEEINAFASVFIETNDWEGLVSFYEFLVKSNGGPADTYTRLKNKCLEVGLTDILDTCTRYAEIYAQLAAAYLEAGQKERARDTALRAAELDPSFKKETELFIKLLENR